MAMTVHQTPLRANPNEDVNLREYGYEVAADSTAATGSDFSGAEKQNYTFTRPMRKVLIQNNDAAADMYIRWNANDAATNLYDIKLPAGLNMAVPSPDGICVASVSIYSTAASTYGTDYTIRGWQ